MTRFAEHFAHVVLQPTTLCNLDCRYCYLPLRKVNKKMPVEVAEAVAHAIEKQGLGRPVKVVWHGGEPLACGISHFRDLIAPFVDLVQEGRAYHVIQTNATLINGVWCEFFKTHRFRVGVSIDGPAWMTDQRVDLRGVSVHAQVLRGIDQLRGEGIPFSAIAVVNNANLRHARELYQFFCELGCTEVGFNIEEMEGVNTTPDQLDGPAVTAFWRRVLEEWTADPRVRVREVEHAVSFARSALTGKSNTWHSDVTPPFPTITWKGDVVLLSPELAGARSDRYGDFVVGNVLETSLVQIVRRGSGSLYVRDFLAGIERCQATCPYWNFCKGGQASNKFQEHGTTDATTTDFCRNSKQRLLDAVVQ